MSVTTYNRSVSFPLPLIKRIEDEMKKERRKFSGFIVNAIEFYLESKETVVPIRRQAAK